MKKSELKSIIREELKALKEIELPTFKVGDKVKWYNMHSKRKKTMYVVSIEDRKGKYGLSICKGCGESASGWAGDMEKV